MNKRQWIYVGPFGRHNKVGLMHGAESGNFMIFYNDKIITIDFKVFDSKSYKFFIDEELCEIHILKHKRKNKYTYEFKFDTKTATSYNILRNKKVKKSNVIGIITVVGVPIFIALAIFSYSSLRKNFLSNQLKENPKDTWATIRVITKGIPDYYETFYYFRDTEGKMISSKHQSYKTPPTTSHGLPLENGDVFAIKYADKYSFYNNINYNKPNEQTKSNLIKRVTPVHLRHHQGKIQQELLCEIQTAYKVAGLNGLADIYYQNEDPKKNKIHNSDSFLRLKRDTPFQNAIRDCWE